ncbi:hypothetical protein ScPMuIL_009266 [Solemya velum]
MPQQKFKHAVLHGGVGTSTIVHAVLFLVVVKQNHPETNVSMLDIQPADDNPPVQEVTLTASPTCVPHPTDIPELEIIRHHSTELLTYLDSTWLNKEILSVQQRSVFHQTICTNNYMEGWHHRFFEWAGGNKLHFYKLAETVDITVQLVNNQQLIRYQRQMYKKTQQKLELLVQYEAKQLKTSAFLEASGKLI